MIACPECNNDVLASDTVIEEPRVEAAVLESIVDGAQSNSGMDLQHGFVLQFLSNLKSSAEATTPVVDDNDTTNAADSKSHRLGELIAKGGMGAVFNACDLNICRNVAMKVMLNPESADEKALLRFVEEAQITGQLEHPGIVPVHQLGVDDEGNLFYTMKYVRGLTLEEILRGLRDGDAEIIKQYPLGKLHSIFSKVCDSMAFAAKSQSRTISKRRGHGRYRIARTIVFRQRCRPSL